MTGVHIAELSWTAYDERLKRDNPVIILPVGSLEQLATDTIIPQQIGIALAEALDGLIAPPPGLERTRPTARQVRSGRNRRRQAANHAACRSADRPKRVRHARMR